MPRPETTSLDTLEDVVTTQKIGALEGALLKGADAVNEAKAGIDGRISFVRGELEQAFFRGRPYENEVAFFHPATRTLILCDLAFNFGPRDAWPTRVLMSLLRSYGKLGPSKLDPLLIRDRAAARASLDRILAWDFDRVIVAHGDVQESGGYALMRDGYAWLRA